MCCPRTVVAGPSCPSPGEAACGSLRFDAIFGEATPGSLRAGSTPPGAAAGARGTAPDGDCDLAQYANGAVLYRCIARFCAPRDAWEEGVLVAVQQAKRAHAAPLSACALAAALVASGFAARTVLAAGHAGTGLSL